MYVSAAVFSQVVPARACFGAGAHAQGMRTIATGDVAFLRHLNLTAACVAQVSQKAMEAILVLQKRPVVNKEFRDLTVGDSPCPPAVYGQRPAKYVSTCTCIHAGCQG
jgi:hypothetical protein